MSVPTFEISVNNIELTFRRPSKEPNAIQPELRCEQIVEAHIGVTLYYAWIATKMVNKWVVDSYARVFSPNGHGPMQTTCRYRQRLCWYGFGKTSTCQQSRVVSGACNNIFFLLHFDVVAFRRFAPRCSRLPPNPQDAYNFFFFLFAPKEQPQASLERLQ